MTIRSTQLRHPRRGAALIFALTLLALFAVLGTSYVVSMSLRGDTAALELRQARARHLAEAGINAAIGELSQAVRENRQGDLIDLHQKTYEFPAYKGVMTPEGYLLDQQPHISHADVTFADESGKLNLNHAPASMLRLVLNVDGATARGITMSMPLQTIFQPEPGPDRQWLSGVDELLSRGLLTKAQYDAADKSLLTTESVADHSHPERFLNVNSAPAEVLAALFDIPLEQAKQAMVRRPFKSLADLEAASGKTADTFNYRPDRGARESLPPELSLDARSFRLVSSGTYGYEGQGIAARSTARVEAVVVFESNGSYTVTSWVAGGQEDDDMSGKETQVAPAGDAATATKPAGDSSSTDKSAKQPG